MLHLVAREQESLPKLYENTYIQKTGGMLGQYGANKEQEPEIVIFDSTVEKVIHEQFGDQRAKVELR